MKGMKRMANMIFAIFAAALYTTAAFAASIQATGQSSNEPSHDSAIRREEFVSIEPIEVGDSLDIDDAMAPGLMEFLDCKGFSSGTIMLGANGKPKTSTISRGADCDTYREQARQSASRLLRRHGFTDNRLIRSRVDAEIAKIDAWFDRSKERSKPLNLGDGMDAVFSTYTWCRIEELKSRAPRSLSTCADAREDAIAKATKALNNDGRTEQERAAYLHEMANKVDAFFHVPGEQPATQVQQGIAPPSAKRD